MSLKRLHLIVITGWFVTLTVVIGTRIALGMPTTLAESVFVFLLGCLPAVIVLNVFRGAGPRNVTQMLHDIDFTPSEVRRLHTRTHSADEKIDTSRGSQ